MAEIEDTKHDQQNMPTKGFFVRWTSLTMALVVSLPQAGGVAGAVSVEELDQLVVADEDSGDEVLEEMEDGPVKELIVAGIAFSEFVFPFLPMRLSLGSRALGL